MTSSCIHPMVCVWTATHRILSLMTIYHTCMCTPSSIETAQACRVWFQPLKYRVHSMRWILQCQNRLFWNIHSWPVYSQAWDLYGLCLTQIASYIPTPVASLLLPPQPRFLSSSCTLAGWSSIAPLQCRLVCRSGWFIRPWRDWGG